MKDSLQDRLGLYEFLVMSFGLSNGSSSFQNFLNNVLSNKILDIFVIAYVDDILIFSKTLEKHKKHVKTVLGQIQVAGLQFDIDKCKFEVQETKYLGLIIHTTTPEGHPGCVKMGPAKTNAIDTWKCPKSIKDV